MSSSTEGKTISCRAAVAWAPHKPLSIEQVEVAPPHAGEVRIKMSYTALCRTDMHSLDGKVIAGVGVGQFPVVFGHEGAGVVESVGVGVRSVVPGDCVIPNFMAQCRECAYCKHTNPTTNLCLAIRETQERGQMPDGKSRFTCRGQTVWHYMGCSTFSEYTVCAEISVAKIDQRAPLDRVCLFGCGFCTGYGAAINDAAVTPNSTVAVFGLGGVGIAAVMGAKKAGARQIVGIDAFASRLADAAQFGVTDFVNIKTDIPVGKTLQEYLVERFDGGFDFTLECVGSVDVMRQALESAHEGWGRSCIVGVANRGEEIRVEPVVLLTGRTWVGTLFGGWKSRDALPVMVDDYMAGKIPLDALITETIALDDINKAFDNMHTGKGYRNVIAFISTAADGTASSHQRE